MAKRLSGAEKFTEQDEYFMNEAFLVARDTLNQAEVPIGCVFVRNGSEIVARGGNETNITCDATRHAEMVALEKLNNVAEGLDLYVTVEPCIMCASALALAKINSVTYGSANDKFGGCGSILSIHNPNTFPLCLDFVGFSSRAGLGNDEAVALLREFYMRGNEKAPNPRQDNMAQRTAKRLMQREE